MLNGGRDMEWKWIEPESSDQKIKFVNYIEEKNEIYQYRLTWQWPREIKNVYVDTRNVSEEIPIEELNLHVKNICTVAEYQRFQGCRNKKVINKGENQIVRIYPLIISNSQEKLIVKQFDEHNYVCIQSPKAKVHVLVNEKKSIFRKTKDVVLTVYSHELDIRKEALCYMRKSGSKPLNNHDGFYNEFIDDIKKGVKSTFNITGIPKNDYINVFLTDLTPYGELIELAKEFN